MRSARRPRAERARSSPPRSASSATTSRSSTTSTSVPPRPRARRACASVAPARSAITRRSSRRSPTPSAPRSERDVSAPRRMVVVGGGPSGLAAAYHATEIAPDVEVVVLEASDRAGGLVRTEHAGGYTIEHGPDSMITDKPRGLALAKRLGLADEILRTRTGASGAYVVCRGQLERVPEGF